MTQKYFEVQKKKKQLVIFLLNLDDLLANRPKFQKIYNCVTIAPSYFLQILPSLPNFTAKKGKK